MLYIIIASSRISEIVSIIASNTVKIEEHLGKTGLPDLSFDARPDSQQLQQHSEIDWLLNGKPSSVP